MQLLVNASHDAPNHSKHGSKFCYRCREANAKRRRIRQLIKLYTSRLEDLQKAPWLVREYQAVNWSYKDAATQFCLQTGCKPELATRFFLRIKQKAEVDAWGLPLRQWIAYFMPNPRLP